MDRTIAPLFRPQRVDISNIISYPLRNRMSGNALFLNTLWIFMCLRQGLLVLVLLSKVIKHNYWHAFRVGAHNKQCSNLDKAPDTSERMDVFL